MSSTSPSRAVARGPLITIIVLSVALIAMVALFFMTTAKLADGTKQLRDGSSQAADGAS